MLQTGQRVAERVAGIHGSKIGSGVRRVRIGAIEQLNDIAFARGRGGRTPRPIERLELELGQPVQWAAVEAPENCAGYRERQWRKDHCEHCGAQAERRKPDRGGQNRRGRTIDRPRA